MPQLVLGPTLKSGNGLLIQCNFLSATKWCRNYCTTNWFWGGNLVLTDFEQVIGTFLVFLNRNIEEQRKCYLMVKNFLKKKYPNFAFFEFVINLLKLFLIFSIFRILSQYYTCIIHIILHYITYSLSLSFT